MRIWFPLFASLIAGCASTTHFTATPVEIPAFPVLPEVKGEELQCVSEDAYKRLVTRYRMVYVYAEQLKILLESTQEIVP